MHVNEIAQPYRLAHLLTHLFPSPMHEFVFAPLVHYLRYPYASLIPLHRRKPGVYQVDQVNEVV